MYNALTSLGAGGLATPWYANATSAAGYGESINNHQPSHQSVGSLHGSLLYHWWYNRWQDWRTDRSLGRFDKILHLIILNTST